MPSSPSSATSKGQSVSYAERAKRLSATSAPMSQTTRSLSTSTSNGNTNASTESNSPSTSSRNLTPNSSVILTRPGTPPPASTVSNSGTTTSIVEKDPAVALLTSPKSPSKPPPTNVWAARKEQMAQRAAAAAAASGHPTSPTKNEEGGAPPKSQTITNKPPLNGNNARVSEVVASKSQDDPFVVRMSARTQPSASVLPSLDDAESWPEMGKIPIASPGASSSTEVEKKDTSSSSMPHHKKGEKTKWVMIPPAELQAASDASQSNSRAHSQNRRHQKSHSRQNSQARNNGKQATQQQHQQQQQPSQRQNVPRDPPRDSRAGSAEVSAAHSRADSVIQSRATSQHSSPMHAARGRRLPEDQSTSSVSNKSSTYSPGSVNAIAGPSTATSNGGNTSRSHSNQGAGNPVEVRVRPDYPGPASGPQSRAHSQPHTPFDTRSPAYHAPPSSHEYRGGSPSHGMFPVYPGFTIPVVPINSQEGLDQPQSANIAHFAGFLPVHQHQPGFVPQPYMYPQMSYGYPQPPPPMHGQGPNPSQFDGQAVPMPMSFDPSLILNNVPPRPETNVASGPDEQGGGGDGVGSHSQPQTVTSLPPSSTRSRPPPPEESEALSGYRTISTIPVSPLLNPLGHTQVRAEAMLDEPSTSNVQREENQKSSNATSVPVAETMIFGTVRPGGMKSPSPENPPIVMPPPPSSSSLGLDVGEVPAPRKGVITAFSVGFQGAGPMTIRIKPRRSGKESDRRSIHSISEGLTTSFSSSSEGVQTADVGEFNGESRADALTSSGNGQSVLKQDLTDDSRDVVVNVIDLTDRESKWEFGTTFRSELDVGLTENANQPIQEMTQNFQQNLNLIHEPQPVPIQSFAPPLHPHPMGYNVGPPVQIHVPMSMLHSSSPQNMHPLPQHIPALAPIHINQQVMSPLSLSSPSPGMHTSTMIGDEWEVRDFGYGSPLNYGSERNRDDRFERDASDRYGTNRPPRELLRDREHGTFAHGPGRGRRGMGSNLFSGYGGGYEGRGYEGRFEGRGFPGGRRGRGGPGGFGRGYRGGRGSYPRHQSMQHSVSSGPRYDDREVHSMQHQQQQQQPAPSDYSSPDAYFPPNETVQYIPEAYAPPPYMAQPPLPPSAQTTVPQPHTEPPVPLPVTNLAFPIDDKRLRLLGQLEYYFSLQNLAQDLFLRQQMDNRGWIPIQLIANFNRVKQQTHDVQLVHEVLNLSELVEVQETFVRLRNGQWRNFILPDAARSIVADISAGAETEGDVDDEDEDDVVFVMHETKQS